MDIDNLASPEVRKSIGFILIGSWGGAIGYFFKHLNDRRKFSISEFLIKIAISGFSAWLMADIIEDISSLDHYHSALLGMAGFLGPETLTLLKNWYMKSIKHIFDSNSNSNNPHR